MSQKPLNTIAIDNFLDLAKIARKTNQKEIRLDAKQAQDLADTIGLVLSRLVELQDFAIQNRPEEVIDIQMDGGKL
jgi:hypothetical protein